MKKGKTHKKGRGGGFRVTLEQQQQEQRQHMELDHLNILIDREATGRDMTEKKVRVIVFGVKEKEK